MSNLIQIAIDAVKDQTSISLAKVNTSSNLQVAILKATTHDHLPVDKHHIYQILDLISSNKTHAAICAKLIIKRITRTRNWIVTLKSLMLVLRILQDGDPYFPREMGAKILNLASFYDDTNWEYTTFVRTFGVYVDERLDCFITGKVQRRYGYETKECCRFRKFDNGVRGMRCVMLLDRIEYWQRLLEKAIAVRPAGAMKQHQLVKIALYVVVRESFDLYKDVLDGLAVIVEEFLCLGSEMQVRVFETFVRSEKLFKVLDEFYSVCKMIGVGRESEYPIVVTTLGKLIGTLQEYLDDETSGLECKSRRLTRSMSMDFLRVGDWRVNETRHRTDILSNTFSASKGSTLHAPI